MMGSGRHIFSEGCWALGCACIFGLHCLKIVFEVSVYFKPYRISFRDVVVSILVHFDGTRVLRSAVGMTLSLRSDL